MDDREMFPCSFMQLSLPALKNNVDFLQTLLGPKVKLCSVVKGNAYGHGIREFVPMAQEAGIESFAVYSADEAYAAKRVMSDHANLMIMGMVEGDALAWAIEHDVEFYVFDLDRLDHAIRLARRLDKPALIHLEVETGMNRTGLAQDALGQALALVRGQRGHIQVRGFCTHLAGAESIGNYARIRQQLETYQRLLGVARRAGLPKCTRHVACSAAIIHYPESIFDMVRVGILQYGFWPSQETQIRYLTRAESEIDPLRRIISWKSEVMCIKSVRRGEFIGYGTSFLANKNMSIAVVPVGYSHGYARALSNTGRVLIGEQRLPVVGIVNMNALIVDITDAPTVCKGDEVVLIGTQGDLSITVASFSEFSNQLNYELLTRLPGALPRQVVSG